MLLVGFPRSYGYRGVFLPPFVRKLATPRKGILHYEEVDHFSTKGDKKTPLYGYRSKLNHHGTTGLSPCFNFLGVHLGTYEYCVFYSPTT